MKSKYPPAEPEAYMRLPEFKSVVFFDRTTQGVPLREAEHDPCWEALFTRFLAAPGRHVRTNSSRKLL